MDGSGKDPAGYILYNSDCHFKNAAFREALFKAAYLYKSLRVVFLSMTLGTLSKLSELDRG